MANTTYDLFRITALSNMHVGSGDINFGVVDKLVQKDVVTDLPTINSSSLKGALREFFEKEMEKYDLARFAFGPSPRDVQPGGGHQGEGNYTFFGANLLSVPVRSNSRPFFRATSPILLTQFLSDIETFGIKINASSNIQRFLKKINPTKEHPLIFENLSAEVVLEGLEAVYCELDSKNMDSLKSILGDNIAIFHHDGLKELCDELPVVARNNLENGISRNLWYEEVVPRQSLFYFILGTPQSDETKEMYSEFLNGLEGNLVQIGANASIGYGFTKIDKVSEEEG